MGRPHECAHDLAHEMLQHTHTHLGLLCAALGEAGEPKLVPLGRLVRAQMDMLLTTAAHVARQRTAAARTAHVVGHGR